MDYPTGGIKGVFLRRLRDDFTGYTAKGREKFADLDKDHQIMVGERLSKMVRKEDLTSIIEDTVPRVWGARCANSLYHTGISLALFLASTQIEDDLLRPIAMIPTGIYTIIKGVDLAIYGGRIAHSYFQDKNSSENSKV